MSTKRSCQMATGTYDWLNAVKQALGVQQSDGVAGYQASQRIANHTQLLDLLSTALDICQSLFYFVCHSLSARLDAIICEASSVALDDKDVELILGVFVTERVDEELEVIGIAPKPAVCVVSLQVAIAAGIV